MSITEHTLPNGLRIILDENHSSKTVSFNALINVGSANETDKDAGLSHVIEHMLFKGTPTRPMGSIAKDVEGAGGDINAYTSLDQTVYYINMASRFANKGLEILADTIQNPLFDKQELEREKEVILEEILREQDNPARMSGEHLFQLAYRTHNYGRPIIGYPETVNGFSQADLKRFHKKWYSPHNIVFIAVGDFDTKKMLANIQNHFSQFKGKKIPSQPKRIEQTHTQIRLQCNEMTINSSYLAIGFHIPEFTHPDVPAIDLLAHILGGTDSSRLEQEIKEKKELAHHIYSYAFTPKDPGLLYIGAVLSDNNITNALSAIRDELSFLQTHRLSTEELSRAKLNLRSTEIYEKESVGGQGSKIASFISAAGTIDYESVYYQRLMNVSPDDILRIANKYLNPNKASISLTSPKGSAWSKKQSKLQNAFRLKNKCTKPQGKLSRHAPYQTTLDNGLTLIVYPNHNLPIVSITAATLAGVRAENKKNNGMTNLLTRMFVKGTAHKDAIHIAKEIEKYAGQISGFSGRNISGLRADFLSDHLNDGFNLVSDILCCPAFNTDEVKKEKSLILNAIKDQEDALSSVAFASFLKQLFPNHPYGLRTIGAAPSVKRLTSKSLNQFYKSHFTSNNMVLSIVGDISIHDACNYAHTLFTDIPNGKKSTLKLPTDPKPAKIQSTVIHKDDKQQAHLVLGFQGTSFSNKDRYIMTVLTSILSGQGGRLFLKLRDEMGLAYAISAVNQEGIEPGFFSVYMGTDPKKIDMAINGILSELQLLKDKKVPANELNRVKQYLIGTYELDLQRNSSLSSLYAFYSLYNTPISDIENYPKLISTITSDDIMRIAQKYFDLNAYTLAIITPK